ncbi:helix-turn-helix domain-containing protein [Lactobacillus amylovorus]|uniref:helix-turn-helix domain-containing protein n=1 Tax=Lactobacillus amylovorus TaxID=1604 RepID=UPI003F8C0298
MTIGEALKKERKDLGLTQAEMAAGVITTAHYSKIERDKHDISAYDLFEILTKNNINLVDFIKEIEDTYQSTRDRKIFCVRMNISLILFP